MATYPNNYRAGAGFNPNYTYFGLANYYTYNAEYGTGAGSRLNWVISGDNAGFSKKASAPDGYGMDCPFPPVVAGGMSSAQTEMVNATWVAPLIQGGPIEGTGSITMTISDSSLGLIISMSGTGSVTFDGDGMVLRLTVGLDGAGSWTLTGTPNLAMIVPFDGSGSWSLTGTSDLRGKLSLIGEWTPYTELSPENLARAVWEAVASRYDATGTMGEKLNDAGSASNPWTEVLEGTFTAAEMLRIISSALAGKTSGAGGTTITFRDLNDTTDRIIGTVDDDGNRTAVTLDGE